MSTQEQSTTVAVVTTSVGAASITQDVSIETIILSLSFGPQNITTSIMDSSSSGGVQAETTTLIISAQKQSTVTAVTTSVGTTRATQDANTATSTSIGSIETGTFSLSLSFAP